MAPTRPHILFVIGLLFGLWLLPSNAAWTLQQLDNFFPQWQTFMHDLLDGKEGDETCRTYIRQDAAVGRGPYRTVECLLKNFYEFRKAEMAAASVILGLTPVLVSQLGPTHTQLALLGIRRPILALVLATETVSVSPLSNQSYINLLEAEIRRSSPSNTQKQNKKAPKRWCTVIISLIEYAAALIALVNIFILAYQLCIWAILSFSLGFKWLPAVYILLAIPLYVMSLVTVLFYFHIRCKDPNCPKSQKVHKHMIDELRPCQFQRSLELEHVELELVACLKIPRKAVADSLAWFVKMCIVLQSVVGTLALSGLLFISVIDAIFIVLRFTASSMVAKMIVSFELSGMMEKTKFKIKKQALP